MSSRNRQQFGSAKDLQKDIFNKKSPRRGASRSGRSHILSEGKFAVPQVSLYRISIPRIEQGFDFALACRLTALSAPAGYGKTTTLAQMQGHAESKGVRTAWVNLSNEDNDPIHFLCCITEALQYAMSDLLPSAFSQVKEGKMPSVEAHLLSLSKELTRIDGALALFLDDYHLIDNEAVHSTMDWLIRRSPDNLKFFIASRAQLPLKLSKLRLAQDIHEITAQDLSLLLGETSSFVKAVGGKNFTADQIKMLHERTEGWITGLHLASLALQKVPDVTKAIKGFSGNDRDITVYFGKMVLHRLPEKLGKFLEVTSLFDRFSSDFCREVLLEEDAIQLIESIKGNHLFLTLLDRQNQWYRYHHLFANYLKSAFVATHPLKALALYGAASAWYERHGLMNEAIRYAFAANDYNRAADLISDHADELVKLRGEHTTLLNWVSTLPGTYVDSRPKIRLAYIWSLLHTHRYAEAKPELLHLERILDSRNAHGVSGKEAELLETVNRKYFMMRCVYDALTEQIELAKKKCVEWLARWEHSGALSEIGTILNTLGYSSYIGRQYEEARQSFVAARVCHERAGSFYGSAWADTFNALISLECGDLQEAERILFERQKLISKKLGPYSYSASVLAAVQAQICYEKNMVDEAERLLDSVYLAVFERQLGCGSMRAYVTKARILCMRGRLDEADEFLVEVVSSASKLGRTRMVHLLNAERIYLQLENDQHQRALSMARSIGFASNTRESEARPKLWNESIGFQLIEVKLQLATGNTEHAYPLLRRLLNKARRYGRNIWIVKLLCINAVMLTKDGRRDEALRLLEEAIIIGAASGLCRTFVDEGILIGDLIQEIVDCRTPLISSGGVAVSHEYMTKILRSFGKTPIQRQYNFPLTTSPQLTEDMLTKREIQILRLLDTGLKNNDLAEKLFLSEKTIKWHLRNIYAKLNVKNRTGAVAKARELSIS